MNYLYDGSFEGLLTAIYLNYYEDRAKGIYPENQYQLNLITPSRIVTTDLSLVAKVYDAIECKISPASLRHVFHVYLSNHPHKENLILNYLQLGFKLGPRLDSYHTHPDVLPVQEMSRKVSFEVHRFLGLLRFAEAGNYLYAVLEPDHHILILLADHFAERLAKENFIIHDRKRHQAIIHNQYEWYLTDFPADASIRITESEVYYQELWTKYFSRIGIESRRNHKLQSHFVPQRYRKNLVEFRNFHGSWKNS